MESYSKIRYHALRSMNRCVGCGKPMNSGKSRCPDCMKKVELAVKESKKRKLIFMENRIKELEALLNV